MYAVKRQLRIWGHEIREAWSTVPFMGRVLLGAATGLGLALFMVNKVIKPLNEDIVELQKGLVVPENLDPEKDEEIIMYRDRTANLKQSLASWEKRLKALTADANALHPEVHLEVIRALQNVLDRCGIMLVSEKLVPQETAQGPFRCFTHAYEVRGGFRRIQAMLLLIEDLPWRMELRNLALKPHEDVPDTLQLNFTLDIFYLAE